MKLLIYLKSLQSKYKINLEKRLRNFVVIEAQNTVLLNLLSCMKLLA